MKVRVRYCVIHNVLSSYILFAIQNISSSHILCVIQTVLSYLYLNSSTLSQELLSVFILLLFPVSLGTKCQQALNDISTQHAVGLFCVPRHAIVANKNVSE